MEGTVKSLPCVVSGATRAIARVRPCGAGAGGVGSSPSLVRF